MKERNNVSRRKNSLAVKILAVAFAVFLSVPFIGVKEAHAAQINYGDPVIDVDTGENSTPATTTSGGGGDINDFDITMEDGKIKTSLDDGGDSSSTWATIFNKGKGFAIGFSGIAMIWFIIVFIKNCMALSANSDNPNGRREAMNACLWTGVAIAICGSIITIVGLFWNAFKG